MVFCILNRETYRNIHHPQKVPQPQKKIKTISRHGGGGREGKIPWINETGELLLLPTLPEIRNNLISHLFPKYLEERKKWFWSIPDKKARLQQIQERVPWAPVTAYSGTPNSLISSSSSQPFHHILMASRILKFSHVLQHNGTYSLYASWKSHQCLKFFCFPKTCLKLGKKKKKSNAAMTV